MGYFNYFLKCIIRRFVRLFFTKKTFIIILIFISLFVFLKSEGYCSEGVLLTPSRQYLHYNSVTKLITPYTRYAASSSNFLDSSYFYIYKFLSGHTYKISTTSSFRVFSCITLDFLSFEGATYPNDNNFIDFSAGYNYDTLLFSNNQVMTAGSDCYYLIKESDYNSHNFSISEVDTLYDGDFSDVSASFNTQSLYLSTSGQLNSSPISDAASYVVSLKPNTDYTYTYNVKSTNSGLPRIAFSNSFPSPGVSVNGYSSLSSPLGTNTKTFNSGNYKYFIFSFRYSEIDSFNITYYGQSGGLDDAISDVGSSIEAGTSKIDGTLNNSNVTVETDLPTDDTEDLTSNGFNNIFTVIYNAFCTTQSQPLVVNLPFIDTPMEIKPDLLSSALKKDSRLNALLVFIQSFWWFKISYSIFKDINRYIERLKSGNITSDDGNIKTEVL